MRVATFVAAAIAAAGIALPAEAATIVQYDSENGAFAGFAGFDTGLGHLDQVSLRIKLYKSRVWQLSAPVPVGSVQSVGWTVAGQWELPASYMGQSSPLLVPLNGVGTSLVTLNNSNGGEAYGVFEVRAAGEALVHLDPSRFLTSDRTYFNGFDTGLYDSTGSDTSFNVSSGSQLLRYSGACYVNNGYVSAPGEDLCGSASYTLTYDYTPSVPEPATWAMMITGLGGVGFAMRRRKEKTEIRRA